MPTESGTVTDEMVEAAKAIAKGYASHPTKDGWEDEDRTHSPSNPMWPWRHMANGDFLKGDVQDLEGNADE
jgi:hypothetical protein